MTLTTREAADAAEDGILVIPLAHLLAIANPLEEAIWECDLITAEAVRAELDTPTTCDHGPLDGTECTACETRRVAHFVTHGVPSAYDDPHPIAVDLGFGSYVPEWPIVDGNHRVLAHVIRGDEEVEVAAFGDWDRVLDVLVGGVDLGDAA